MDDSAILDEMSRTLHSIADRPGNGGSGTGSPSLPNSPPSNLSSRPLKSPLNAVPIVLASSSTANNRRTRYKKNENSTAIEYISSLSTRVGETTKRKIWDSNDMYVDGAARARDKYERIYHAAKTSCKSAYSATLVMYSTAKSGAETIENGLLVPVRDYLILPSFWIVEKSITGTTAFVFSDRMANACNFSLSLIEDYIPFNVGKRIVAPTIRTSFNVAHTSVLILQYPIPSQQTVTSITTKTVNSTKWALGVVGREVFFYVDMVDVSMTRALAKARWSVLGFGQYAGLSQEQREEVASQMCERYLDMPDPIARYEFASHVRIQNKRLYDDLIRSGLLRRRGGSLCENDTWLDVLPEWRLTSKNIETDDLFSDPEFISMKRISSSANNSETTASIVTTKVVPLWFYMPLVNGSRPSRDTPWVRFGENDRAKIEAQYMGRGRGGGGGGKRHSSAPKIGPVPAPAPGEGDEEDDAVDDPFTQISDDPAPSSLSQWHEPDTSSDVFVDEGRHVVTWKNKKPKNTNTKNSICLMKPVFWRYYGDGEPVRRCVWMLDSGKAGLQPFNDQSAGVLEDAYQFLKWQQVKRRSDETTLGELMDPGGSSAAVLLTVQVQAPDGEEQLIQFRSLHQIFAIKKTLGGALSIWKKRVYRGAEVVIEERDGVGEIADAETSGSSGEQFVNGMNMFVEEFSEKPESTEEQSAAERRKNEHVVERSVAAPSPFSSAHRAKPTSEQVEDNVEHLILVVHGIGKALQAFDLLGLVQLKSIVDCCKWMRDNHEEVVNEQQQQRANQKRNSAPSSPFPTTTSSSRVEFIPIEWHERFNRVSRQNDSQIPTAGLNDISLKTIPHMRSFANDAMLDTLYFMSEPHHDQIINLVVHELNTVVEKFRKFKGKAFTGKVSFVAHSLGSVVTWDILANQMVGEGVNTPPVAEVAEVETAKVSPVVIPHFDKRHLRHPPPFVPPPRHHSDDSIVAPVLEDESPSKLPKAGRVGVLQSLFGTPPSQRKKNQEKEAEGEGTQSQSKSQGSSPTQPQTPTNDYPQLTFPVQNTFMLGSPIAVFLLIRNQQQPLQSDYSLPGCSRMFNIFHPFDPAAYRLEPLINRKNANTEASLIPTWKGDFRVKYKAKIFWRKLWNGIRKTRAKVFTTVEDGISKVGLLDSSFDVEPLTPSTKRVGLGGEEDGEGETSESDSEDGGNNLDPGRLCSGARVDYVLQEKEIESTNEYLFALGAHSMYWAERDLSYFIAKEVLRGVQS